MVGYNIIPEKDQRKLLKALYKYWELKKLNKK